MLSAKTRKAQINPLKCEHLEAVERWLENVVLAMNLCPFAAYPRKQNLVRINVCFATSETEVKNKLKSELALLASCTTKDIETTLVATPKIFADFFDYMLFSDQLNSMLKREGYEGQFQIATFHPRYQFAGTQVEDKENYTNRAPFPIFHLLREDSLDKAIASHPDTEEIFRENIEKMRALSDEQIRSHFDYGDP